jgi:hypothetical protein
MIKLEFEDFDWDVANKSKILKRFEIHIVEEFFKQDLFIFSSFQINSTPRMRKDL